MVGIVESTSEGDGVVLSGPAAGTTQDRGCGGAIKVGVGMVSWPLSCR